MTWLGGCVARAAAILRGAPCAIRRQASSDMAWTALTDPYTAPEGLRLHPVTHAQGLGLLVAACADDEPAPGPLARWIGARRGVAVPDRADGAALAERAATGRLQVYAVMDGAMPVGYARLSAVGGGVALERGGLICAPSARKPAERSIAAFVAAVSRGELPLHLSPNGDAFAPIAASGLAIA